MVFRLLSSAILVVCTAFKNASWKSDKKGSQKKRAYFQLWAVGLHGKLETN